MTLVYGDSTDSAKFIRYLNAKASPLPLPGATPSFAFDVATSYFHDEEDEEEEEEVSAESEGGELDEESSDEVEEEEMEAIA